MVTITSLALELPRKSVKHSSWKQLSYCFNSYINNIVQKCSKFPSRLSLFGRSLNSWRVRANALTLQQFTDRPNNDRRSLGSLELILCFAMVEMINHIRRVMVSVLASSAVDRGFEPRSGQIKDYKIGIYCYSAKDAALKRKDKDWLVRDNDNLSKWGDLSTRGLLFQWASTIKIQLSVFV